MNKILSQIEENKQKLSKLLNNKNNKTELIKWLKKPNRKTEFEVVCNGVPLKYFESAKQYKKVGD